jgi:hypothetical protein
MTAVVLSFKAGRERRLAELQVEVAYWREALAIAWNRFGRTSWQYEITARDLVDCERRLSVAQGCPR